MLSTDAWLAQASPRPLLIDGRLAPPDPTPRTVCEPATGKPLGLAAQACGTQGEEAVRSARHAADSGPWPRMAAASRGEQLGRLARRLADDADELARLLARESGLPLREAAFAWSRCVDWAAGSLSLARDGGTWRQVGYRTDLLSVPRPLGVALVLGPAYGAMPHDFLLAFAALARGNAVIWLAAEERPLVSLRIAEHALHVGLPPGVLQILAGGDELAAGLSAHRAIELGACVGHGDRPMSATHAGRRTFAAAWRKGSVGVFSDADLDVAAASAVLAATFGGGLGPWAGQKLYVTRKNHDHLLLRILSRLGSLTIGNPIDFDTEIGPMPGEGVVRMLEEHVARRQAEGATLIYGGDRPAQLALAGGSYWRPALMLAGPACELRDVPGPVLEVQEARDDDELLELLRRGSGPCTILSRREEPARLLRTSGGPHAVAWNADWPTADVAPPFVDGLFATALGQHLRAGEVEPSAWYRGG